MRLVHLTTPKSGSQWITDVLSDPRVLAFAPGIRFERCGNHTLEYWSQQPDGIFMGAMFSMSFDQWEHFRGAGDKAIYVLRDPRDCIISWTFSSAFSHETQPHIALVRPVLLSLSLHRRLMLGIYQYWQSSWIVRTWAGRRPSATEYPVEFEAILADETGAFSRMFEFLSWPVPRDVVAEVAAAHSFEVKSRGRPRGELDTYSHFRRGKPGDWRNYFDRELGRLFEEACPHLLVELGYEKREDWYGALPETIAGLKEGDVAGAPFGSAGAAEELVALRAERAALARRVRDGIARVDHIAQMLTPKTKA